MRLETIVLLGLAFALLKKQDAPPSATPPQQQQVAGTPSNDWQDWLPTPPALDELSEFWT